MLLSKNMIFVMALSLMSASSLWASSNGAQKGRSGRPGGTTGCSGCHSSVTQVEMIPSITFSQSEDVIRVGESLVFMLDVESNDAAKTGFGFNIAVDDTSVGVFSSSTGVRLNSSDNSEVTHQQTLSYPNGSNSFALEITFTPAAVGEHSLYMVINEVNGLWNMSGDAWSAHSWTFNVTDSDSTIVDAGSADGFSDGTTENDAGISDGSSDGMTEPDAGTSDGSVDGTIETDAGTSNGSTEEVTETDAGVSDGSTDGSSDGTVETDAGTSNGATDGATEIDAGVFDGSTDGSSDGTVETDAGVSDGNSDGTPGADAGTTDGSTDGSSDNATALLDDVDQTAEEGCNCNTQNPGSRPEVILLGFVCLGLSLRRRRM